MWEKSDLRMTQYDSTLPCYWWDAWGPVQEAPATRHSLAWPLLMRGKDALMLLEDGTDVASYATLSLLQILHQPRR